MVDIDLFGLKDTHVVITGASGGIGLATVELFDKLGARITAQANTQAKLLRTFPQTTHKLNILTADATNEAQIENFYKEACSESGYGPPDVLVGTSRLVFTDSKYVMEFSSPRKC